MYMDVCTWASCLFLNTKKNEPCYVDAANLFSIVDEDLFNRVQEVIGARTPVNVTKNTFRDEFPLRGFLI